jgi:DUF4097 and DUF4098 domain-containing protein YvlB
MARFIIRLVTVVIVASLPYPLYAHEPGASHQPAWRAMSWRASYEARQGPEATQKVVNRFKVGPSGTLDISNFAGRIAVTAGGTDTIIVEAMKRVRSREGDVKAQLEHTVVNMSEQGGRVEVRTTFDGRNPRAAVDYAVTAPAGTSVYAHSISGDIKITGITGEVRADTVSGDVDAVSTPGATLVRSVSGNASVSGASNPNELRASSVSGMVTVRGAKVRSLEADTISGDVRLTDATCDRVAARSISGTVSFDGPLVKNGRYEFKSQSGDISLALTGTPGFELDASTFSGNVRSDLPVTVAAGETQPGRRSHRGIHGVHGDGSAQLVLTSFSGDITIAKKGIGNRE